MTLALSVALAATACDFGSKGQIQRTIPPVADMRVQPEPALPAAVFETDQAGEPTPAAVAAEEAWEDEALIWGRAGWRQVGRICRWAEEIAGDVAGLECPPG